jgi:hypothetical protein
MRVLQSLASAFWRAQSEARALIFSLAAIELDSLGALVLKKLSTVLIIAIVTERL